MSLEPIQNTVNALAVDDHYIYVGMGSYQVLVMEKSSYTEIIRLKQELWEVKDIAIHDNYVFVSSLNQKITVFKKGTWEFITMLDHELGVLSLYIDGERLFTTSYDGRVLICQINTNGDKFEEIGQLENHIVKSNCVITHNNDIITGEGFKTIGATIKIWDKASFQLKKSLAEPECRRITCFNKNQEYLFSGHGGPGECRIWDLKDYSLIKKFRGPSEVKKIILQNENLIIVFHSNIIVVDLNNLAILKEIELENYEIKTAMIDPVSNNSLIIGTREKLVFLNINNGNIEQEITITQ